MQALPWLIRIFFKDTDLKKAVHYISHGNLSDGGYRHERFFAQSLSKVKAIAYQEFRKEGLFSGLNLVGLFIWGMRKSNAMFNVVSMRLGLSAILRNILNKNVVYVVLHDYDSKRYNSIWLRIYLPLLFGIFKFLKPKRLFIVVESPFWKSFFHQEKGVSMNNLVLFPNLLDVDFILSKKTAKQKGRIHLGQWSEKNSELVFDLADKLHRDGYNCYFSTLDKRQVGIFDSYEVKTFDSYGSYLKEMAGAEFTIAFSKFHEGWNRVVHESALLDTPVVGFPMGGMKYLIQETNNYVVETVEEALHIIEAQNTYQCPPEFLYKYDTSKVNEYL